MQVKQLLLTGAIQGPYFRPWSPLNWLRRAWLKMRISDINDELSLHHRTGALSSAQAVNWMQQRDWLERRLEDLR
jgi:hypothetical protein